MASSSTVPVGAMARLKGFLPTLHGSSNSSTYSSTGSLSEALLQRRSKVRTRLRGLAFVCSMISCLSAGSFLIFSMYAPLFQLRLRYSALEVNAVAISGLVGMYLLVPIFGFLCDKWGPARLSMLSIFMFTPGYLFASYVYRKRLPYHAMLAAFVLVGAGTSCMYMSGVATCAKNFTKRRGLALAMPIAAFGLSSLWMSQVANEFFYVRDGKAPPANAYEREVDVARLFVFFAIMLMSVGLLGAFGLRILPEEDASDDERRPLIQENEGYGTIEPEGVINQKTKEFLKDPTMWLFSIGFFLVTGPGEAFMANMGTLLHSINPRSDTQNNITTSQIRTDPAFHVGIVALTSTIARILAGLVSDYFQPPTNPHLDDKKRFHISRVTLITLSAAIMLIAHVPLFLGVFQRNPTYFWIVSSAIGWGYGAVFCLAPNVVSCIWGTENFGTNWGFVTMMPAGGATVFGVLFAKVYDAEAARQHSETCWGLRCYQTTFGVMTVSVCCAMAFWVVAWKGRGGWVRRGLSV